VAFSGEYELDEGLKIGGEAYQSKLCEDCMERGKHFAAIAQDSVKPVIISVK